MSKLGLLWANLFRRRTRTLLTLLSLLVAFLLFILLRTIAWVFAAGGGFGQAGVDRLVVTAKYSIIDPLPISALQQIQAVEGVDAVTHAEWFGGVYQDRANFFPKYPVDPLQYFDLHPELRLEPEQLHAFANTRTGAVAPRTLAEKYGWSIGDKIPIQGDIYGKRDGGRDWQFDLVGLYDGLDEQPPEILLMHYDYFDEARDYGEGTTGWFIVRLADRGQAAEVANRIDRLFANSSDPTRTTTEAEQARQFMQQVGDMGLMMNGILGAVFFTILLLTGNTMAQSLRERVPELAVLKALGFTDAAMSALVLGEAVLLCLLGTALGIAGALSVAVVIGPGIAQTIGSFEVQAGTVTAALGLALLLGLAVGAFPAWRARRLSIVEALRAA